MTFLKKSSKVFLCCSDPNLKEYWKSELIQAGFHVHCMSSPAEIRKVSASVIVLLLDTDENTPETEQTILLFNEYVSKTKHFFVVSSDTRWSVLTNYSNSTQLPSSTHPLELARQMVERHLTIPLNQSAKYAFSFLQF